MVKRGILERKARMLLAEARLNLFKSILTGTALAIYGTPRIRPSKRLMPRIRVGKPVDADDFFLAAASGDTMALDKMIINGVNLDAATPEGFTALMAGAMEGQSRVVRRLLEKGADPNFRHSSGLTALLCAIRSKSHDCVKLLLFHGASLGPMAKEDLAPMFLAQLMGTDINVDEIYLSSFAAKHLSKLESA
jgi:ankyrin repeat protein